MSLFADIQSLEDRIQKEFEAAANYKSIDNFVKVYQESILQSLGNFSRGDLAKTDIDRIVSTALENSRDFIDEDLIEQIESGVNNTISQTVEFYEDLGVQPVSLIEGIERREEIITLTEEFNNNMSSMREELREGTVQKIEEVLGRDGMNRSLIADEILEFADGRAHWARTNARMVVSSSNRIARDELRISADLKHGYYYGEIRNSTRAFCRSCVGSTFTTKQIEEMSNGQGLDVKIYAGGWNCIHSWLWVNPDWDPELEKTMESNRPIVSVDDGSLKLSIPGDE